jgi:hypothetical protein
MSWQGSNRLFLGTFIGLLAAVYLFVLLVDPYGVVPFSPPFERPVMSLQRQMYSQILRTGRYDSVVVGTSTVMTLDPVALDRALGGHFANLALPSETAWEQVRIVDYFRRTVVAPKAVLIGIDHEWCYRDSNAFTGKYAAREKAFPSWAYDGNRWNKVLHLLNTPTLDAAKRTVGHVLGEIPERAREDGYEVITAAEAAYDPARAHDNIWGDHKSGFAVWGWPADLPGTAPDAIDLPALPWLDASLAALPATTRKLLVFPPVHAHMLPDPGSPRAARDAECKSRVAAIARRRGAVLADWHIASQIAAEDTLFFDLIHYRLPVAYRLIDDLGHIVGEGRESPDGSYRIVVDGALRTPRAVHPPSSRSGYQRRFSRGSSPHP